jgi:small subunit ribosomal protein S1
VLERDTVQQGQVTQNDIGGPEELAKAYEESIKNFDEGDIVAGKVVSVDKDEVLLDIGYKSEALLTQK